MRDLYLIVDKAIEGCRLDEVPEIRSLGRTLSRWRAEILNGAHVRGGLPADDPSGDDVVVDEARTDAQLGGIRPPQAVGDRARSIRSRARYRTV